MYRPKYVEKTSEDTNTQAQIQTRYRQKKEYDEQSSQSSNQWKSNQYRKPKYVQKQERDDNDNSDRQQQKGRRPYKPYNNRNQYSRDESKIYFYTQLPPLPEFRKKRPNYEDYLEKIKKIDEKKDKLKQQRVSTVLKQRQEKDSLKNLETGSFKKLQVVVENISIGQKAVKALTSDAREIERRIDELNQKINGLEGVTEKLERKVTRTKNLDDMSVRELDQQIKKLEHRVITQTLDKKEMAFIRGQIDKCKKLKINNSNLGDEEEVNKEDILKDKLSKLSSMKQARRKLKEQKHEIDVKLRKTIDELEGLEDEKEALEEQKDEFKKGADYEKTKAIKEQILNLRDQKQKEQQRYERALRQYQDQQKLVEYVTWASDVKKRKLQQREIQRAQRQKQRQRQGKKDKNEKEGEATFERPPPPHPYAKQIGYCNFLIQYCQDLKPVQSTPKTETVQKAEVNVQQEIKKGVWAKEKGIEVIIPKKKLNIDEAPQKKQHRVREKPNKEVENNEVGHNLQIQRIFEQVKLTAPKVKDVKSLDQTIAKLQEKKDYYQNNFSATRPDERKEEKTYQNDKRTKIKYEKKGQNKEKLKLELADFPALV